MLPDYETIIAEKNLVLGNMREGVDALEIGKLASKGPVLWIVRDDVRLRVVEELLRYFHSKLPLHLFPAWDTVPYDRLSPSADVLSTRLATLLQMEEGIKSGIILAPVAAVIQKIPPQHSFRGLILTFEKGKKLDRHQLALYFAKNGYNRTATVREVGEFALRGSIIDVFPTGFAEPVRIDLFGDEVESIRTFDPISQRTLIEQKEIKLTPASEVILSDASIERFRHSYRRLFGAKATNDPLYEAVSAGQWFAGVENWLPLFYDTLGSIFDYLPHALVVMDDQSTQAADARFEQIHTHFADRLAYLKADSTYRPLVPDELYLTSEIWQQKITTLSPLMLSAFKQEGKNVLTLDVSASPDFAEARQDPKRSLMDEVVVAIRNAQKNFKHIVIVSQSDGSEDRLKKMLSEHGLDSGQVQWTQMDLEHGFIFETYYVLTETDILGERMSRMSRPSRKAQDIIEEASQITVGDLVVHQEHGIGKYMGLETLVIDRAPHDCLKLIFAGNDKLYVPVENIEVLSRYGADGGDGQLDRLGGVAWQARKAKVKQRLREMADGLIKIAAARAMQESAVLVPNVSQFDEFCSGFQYIETQDQLRAIEDTLTDLTLGRPMDRLVCGDVGFGKTEVAMRAAFIAAAAGYTVVVVVPTTLLARQHYQNFSRRFKDFNIRVEMLSRLTSAKAAKQIKEDLASGRAQVVIGTHSLLAKSVNISNLGLVIVDEEQHFGVAQKEFLKSLQATTHILTLSATPIPRTLQMSLSGLKELSLISTPPVDRLAVKTFISPYDEVMIKEAILREKFRGGQTFYVCPRIKDLDSVKEDLQKMIPDLRIGMAHGQLSPTNLEKVMGDFVERKYDVLLATNIIESGLDIPTANTLIVHRADLFGLGQLYQIRGRVGRSKVRAYALFTVPKDVALTESAQRRLEVMQTLDYLGAGFALASHDMDIRGAGNLLGEEQSGHVREVGIELYQHMLEEAVADAKASGKQSARDEWSPTINITLPILIPDTYVADLSLRLSLYRRISLLSSTMEADTMAAELIDRFGKLPEEVDNLLKVVVLKNQCRKAGIEKVDVGPKGVIFALRQNKFKNPEALLGYIQSRAATLKIRPDQKLFWQKTWATPLAAIEGISLFVDDLIKMIG